jgi:hypothetical protein
MQNKRQHGALSLVSQGRGQADIPFQAHRSLLGRKLLRCAQPPAFHGEFAGQANFTSTLSVIFKIWTIVRQKVTIIIVFSVHTSSNKALAEPYNPNTIGLILKTTLPPAI